MKKEVFFQVDFFNSKMDWVDYKFGNIEYQYLFEHLRTFAMQKGYTYMRGEYFDDKEKHDIKQVINNK